MVQAFAIKSDVEVRTSLSAHELLTFILKWTFSLAWPAEEFIGAAIILLQLLKLLLMSGAVPHQCIVHRLQHLTSSATYYQPCRRSTTSRVVTLNGKLQPYDRDPFAKQELVNYMTHLPKVKEHVTRSTYLTVHLESLQT